LDWIADYEFWKNIFESFTTLGPIGGILLTMIEAFIPPLPLSLFVTINVYAFGFLGGYIYSYIGTTVGSIAMFYIIKRYGTKKFQTKIKLNEKLRHRFDWIKEKGFVPIFLLLSFPFTPSIVVCGLAALADVKNKAFIWAIVLGKLLMVLNLSFIGYNITSFVEQPIKSLFFIFLSFSISLLARKVIPMMEKRKKENKMP
jgi:uncharacterized membrane protein YdjX (TVP38/TMEM64 family)